MFKSFTQSKTNNYIKRLFAFILSLCVVVTLGVLTVSAEPETTTGAVTPAGDAWGWLQPVILIAVFGALMYFMLYRPQKKQQKAATDMRNSLKVGDEISTNGGILGKVTQIKDEFIVIETGNDRTKLKLAKWSIRAVEHRAEDDEDDEEE